MWSRTTKRRFVHKGQTQPAEVLLDAVQGFDEVLKSPMPA